VSPLGHELIFASMCPTHPRSLTARMQASTFRAIFLLMVRMLAQALRSAFGDSESACWWRAQVTWKDTVPLDLL